ncbi:MAG: sigma-E processing peptidase SpoIIGA [Lachnospira sp.]
MLIVIYLDVLFAVNFCMDLMVLTILNHLMHYHASVMRLLLSTTLGAVWSVAAVLIPDRYKLLVNLCTYIIITFLMVLIICIRGKNACEGNSFVFRKYIGHILKGMILMISIAVFIGGGIHLLVYNTYTGYVIYGFMLKNRQFLLFLLISITFLMLLCNYINTTKRDTLVNCDLEVVIGNEHICTRGIIDTGNTLVDPIYNKPVNVFEKMYFSNILSEINNYENIKFHFIPYNTVSTKGGLMEVITADYMYIKRAEDSKAYKNVLIGLSEVNISSDGGYHALINGKMI